MDKIRIIPGILLAVFIIISVISCKESQPDRGLGNSSWAMDGTANNFVIVADSIVYDVIIKNPDPEDDWTETCLQSLHREELIDVIFEAVLNKKIKAYDIFTNEEFKVRDLKKIESDVSFSRKDIGKIQFQEEWNLDESTMQMIKRVSSITFGRELIDSEGDVWGYAPVFKVYLPNP